MLTVLSAFTLAQVIAPRPGVPVVPPAEVRSPARPSQIRPAIPPTTPPQPAAPSRPPITSPPPTGISPPSFPALPPRPFDIVQTQEVRPLPGELDSTPVFNSNSPELIQTEGILLSTFPSAGMRTPEAHLDYPFQGRFDIFAHHIARGITPNDVRTLYVGILISNPSNQPVRIEIGQGVSYLSQEAPFFDLPAYVANPMGTVYAGPGSRTANDVLRRQRQPHWPTQIVIPPGGTYLLANVPIPLRRLTVATNGTLPPGYIIPGLPTPSVAAEEARTGIDEGNTAVRNTATGKSTNRPAPATPPVPDNRPLPSNGRTVLMQLNSSGPVYVASLAMYAPLVNGTTERVPTQAEWEALLRSGTFAGPRDRTPTPPNSRSFTRFFYGRVAGVSQGTEWSARATDNSSVDYLSIPRPGRAFSYVLSTVDRNTFGTGQIQSAPMLVRYPDTAYRAHGNYGVQYNVSLPLQNNTDATQQVTVMMQTPIQDEQRHNGLRFRNPPYEQIFFRGTVRIRFVNDFGIPQTRYIHVVQRRGQEGQPLIRLTMPRGARRQVDVQFIYPPDATPPQVITVQTIENTSVADAAPPESVQTP